MAQFHIHSISSSVSSVIGSVWTARRVNLNRNCQIAALGLLLGAHPLIAVAQAGADLQINLSNNVVELFAPVSSTEKSAQSVQAGVGRQAVQFNRTLNKMPLQGTARFSMTRGGSYDVVYDRRIDHPSGNVTWVGSLKDYGDDYRAMITFGAGGVSGRIVTPEGEFLVETDADGEWLIDTQAAGLTPASDDADDAIIPVPEDLHKSLRRDPADAADPASDETLIKNNPLDHLGNLLGVSDQQAVIAADTTPTTIDVMILYTPGLASRLGSGLSARLDQLVALSNQTYRDSGVYINLRMVHSQQVNYSDATTNATALSALTNGSDPALADVARLRDAKGADLVSLARPYNKETSGGSCGVAWLIGSGGKAESISSYSSRGYSVISDGKDVNNSGYYCGDLTFTHELGHNMGLAHDRSNASSQGAYSYSYGYGVNGSFGTVMSYATPRIGKFSNPAITCAGGISCGVNEAAPDSANNALSLNNTRHAIAGFRNAQADSAAVSYDLTISKSGDGAVTSNLVGIHCGDDCTESYSTGTSIVLTATPAAGSAFVNWSGACAGSSLTCTVLMTAARNVTATFNKAATTNQYTVTVVRNGDGVVTSNQTGINCGSVCSASFDSGTRVGLSATPASGYAFSGSSSSCANNLCTVTVNFKRL